jgi:hypothetical protein
LPPLPPLPPDAPEFYFFDRDADGPIRLRMSTPEFRGDLPPRAREALERALELAPRVRSRFRVEMDALDGDGEERLDIDAGEMRPMKRGSAGAAGWRVA